jgi:hypothetical protein
MRLSDWAWVEQGFETWVADHQGQRVTRLPEGPHPTYQVPTPYGLVEMRFDPPARALRGSGWVYCRLLGWDAPQGVFRWFGWNHWKQNWHCEAFPGGRAETLRRLCWSLDRLWLDQGWGFPCLPVHLRCQVAIDRHTLRNCKPELLTLGRELWWHSGLDQQAQHILLRSRVARQIFEDIQHIKHE